MASRHDGPWPDLKRLSTEQCRRWLSARYGIEPVSVFRPFEFSHGNISGVALLFVPPETDDWNGGIDVRLNGELAEARAPGLVDPVYTFVGGVADVTWHRPPDEPGQVLRTLAERFRSDFNTAVLAGLVRPKANDEFMRIEQTWTLRMRRLLAVSLPLQERFWRVVTVDYLRGGAPRTAFVKASLDTVVGEATAAPGPGLAELYIVINLNPRRGPLHRLLVDLGLRVVDARLAETYMLVKNVATAKGLKIVQVDSAEFLVQAVSAPPSASNAAVQARSTMFVNLLDDGWEALREDFRNSTLSTTAVVRAMGETVGPAVAVVAGSEDDAIGHPATAEPSAFDASLTELAIRTRMREATTGTRWTLLLNGADGLIQMLRGLRRGSKARELGILQIAYIARLSTADLTEDVERALWTKTSSLLETFDQLERQHARLTEEAERQDRLRQALTSEAASLRRALGRVEDARVEEQTMRLAAEVSLRRVDEHRRRLGHRLRKLEAAMGQALAALHAVRAEPELGRPPVVYKALADVLDPLPRA